MSNAVPSLPRAVTARFEVLGPVERSRSPSYHALDRADGQPVVLRFIDPAAVGAESAERLVREIRALPPMAHAALLRPLDAGEADGLVYYAVPLVQGETLAARLQRDGAIPVPEAIRISRRLGAALEVSATAGVMPTRIRLDQVILAGGDAYLDDAGLAFAIDRSHPESVAATAPPSRDGFVLAELLERMVGGPDEGLAAAKTEHPPDHAPNRQRRAAAIAIGTGVVALGALLASRSKRGRHRGLAAPIETGALPSPDSDLPQLNVRQFGAVGNEIADDTDAIQRAIDALLPDHGGTVVFPPGTYRITRSIRPVSNCRLVGAGYTDRSARPTPASLIKGPGVSQPLIECGTGLTSVQLVGLGFYGSSYAGGKGVHAVRVDNLCIEECFFDNFGDQALHIEGGLAAYLRTVFVQNACLVRTPRASVVGAVELGNDDTYGYGINANASIVGQGKYVEGKVAAVYLSGAGALLTNCLAGFAEVGFALGPNASNTRLLGCRGEFNQGPGFAVAGSGNTFIGNVAFANSQSVDNGHSGFVITGGQNLFANNRVAGTSQDAAQQRDGFEDRFACCGDLRFANHYYGNRLGPDVRGSLYAIREPSLHGTADLVGPDFRVSQGAIVARRAQRALVRPPFGRVVTPDAALADYFIVNVTDGKPWALAEPLHPPPFGWSQEITIDMVNRTGGPLGTISFAPCYRMDSTEWLPPGPGRRRVLVFYFEGTCWIERSRTGDI